MNNVSQANFLLIDGVLRPNAIVSLYQSGEPLEIEPLYSGTRWSELRDLGPILVSLKGSTNLPGETYQNTCLMRSPAPINIVANHLRRFIAPSDVRGGKSLLRFADPLVAGYWLGSHQGEHRDAVLGPIDAWHVPERLHAWELAQPSQWRSFCRTTPAPDWVDTYAQLGEVQLDALEQAARWRFVEQLHYHFEQNQPQLLARIDKNQLTQWFDVRLAEAHTWGLVSDRSRAIWVEYSLRWGDGFTEYPDGPYQRWLARTPDAFKLAPELRIQQMDSACLHIEPNKDA